MEKKQFKIGDKVKIPETKSTGLNINDSALKKLFLEEKHDYLIVKGIYNLFPNSSEKIIECIFPTSKMCTQFLNTDLEHYEEEIIGYKLIKPEYEEAALKITGMTNQHWAGFSNNKFLKTEKFNCAGYEDYVVKLKEAGVLDLWFEPVYKEEKQIIQMYSSNKGMFEIEVVDGKAYYRPENRELPEEWIRDIINSYDEILIQQRNGVNPYNVQIAGLHVGCMKDTKKEDWEKVYELLK